MREVGFVAGSRRSRCRAGAAQRGALPTISEVLRWDDATSRRRYEVLAAVYEALPQWQRDIVLEMVAAATKAVDAEKFAPTPTVAIQHERIRRFFLRTMTPNQKRAYWREAARRRLERKVC